MRSTNPSMLIGVALLALQSINPAQAQRGMPAPVPTTAQVHTKYAQHEDFKESLLSRLKVPAGFKVEIAASGLGKPRMMLFTNPSTLYVTRRDQGDVLMLKDTNGDGKFEELKTVIAGFQGVHGIAMNGGWMYLVSNRELRRGKMHPDGMMDSLQVLLKDLPDAGQHPNRTLFFDKAGMLYITVGSTCNDCVEANPENATVLLYNPKTNTRTIYARGLRNTIGMDWHPTTGELWGADHGSDMKGDDIPGEEINRIVKEGDYGWPLVFEKQVVDETREDPPGSTKAEYAKRTVPAQLLLPAHSAPMAFTFLNKVPNLPADYAQDALVTLHGSWNKSKPDGFKIVRIRFQNGVPTASEDFLTGFLSADGGTRFGRPVSLALSTGGIYFSDDANGVIYRIYPSK